MGNIGIMGGTFDPIHNGHLFIGREAYLEYGLDEIWFMPSGDPPHKADRFVTGIKERCDMTRLAIADYPYFKFSGLEAERSGKTYTAQTLRELRKDCPKHKFFFIVGADSLFQIETWYQPEEIFALATLIVARRNNTNTHSDIESRIEYLVNRYGADILSLHCRKIDVSSEQLRKKINDGESIREFVPHPVIEYIKEHHLYQEET